MAGDRRRVDVPHLRPFRMFRRQVRDATPGHVEMLLANASSADRKILERALPHSMTGAARMLALIDAVRYCVHRGVPGDFAECGVWRGGSAMAMILTLQELNVSDRDLYLYDTFEGMTEPTEHDVSAQHGSALRAWQDATREGQRPWGEMFGAEVFNEEQVRTLLVETGYPAERLHLVRGKVEMTIPEQLPDQFALLRLDTDWYESTRHELIHMFPRLCTAGVLIVDDYGHWKGAQKATDEYLASVGAHLLLHRVDYTARIAIKA